MSSSVYRRPVGPKELVAATPTQRNWRGILISLLVIGVVSALIVTCVILLTPPDQGPRIKGRLVTVDDLVDSVYETPPDNAHWVNADELVFRDDNGGISVYNAKTRTTTPLVRNRTLHQTNTEDFLVSPDLRYVLLSRKTKVSTYSQEALYWIWPVDTGFAYELRPEPSRQFGAHPALQHVAWVRRPDPARGRDQNALVMVHNNNIYYKHSALSADSFAVTASGRPNVVYHGVPDLLYGEHILRSDRALWPSPEGTSLLYFTINCTQVDDLKYTTYGRGRDPGYPKVHNVKFPPAGGTNPHLTVVIANVSTPAEIEYFTVQPPSSLANRELYAAGVRWVDETQVSVTWYNRRQNVSHVTVCSAPSWRCQTVFQTSSLWPSGLETRDEGPLFSPDRQTALLLQRLPDGPNTFYSQIVMVDVLIRSVTQITQERADVVQIAAWTDEYIYYVAALPDRPAQRHLHRVSGGRGSPLTRQPTCLTCSQVPPSDHAHLCLHHHALFSPTAAHYALRCLGPAVPYVTVSSTDAQQMALVRNNTALRRLVSNTSLPAVRVVTVPGVVRTADRAVQRDQTRDPVLVRLHVPPQYRPGDVVVYPLVVRLRAQSADHQWRVDWASYVASQLSFVVADVAVPPRPQPIDDGVSDGSVLGAAEVDVLRRVVTNLTSTLDYLTPSRVIALGQGHGGYQALSLLARTEKLVHCAVALAPITTWQLYVSAVSERLLGLPEYNMNGYSESDLGRWAPSLLGKRLLLVHGTADVTVGVQQTFLLARRLERAGVVFRQMIYPDEGHELEGVREHLYRTLEQYFHQCFLPTNVKDLLDEEI